MCMPQASHETHVHASGLTSGLPATSSDLNSSLLADHTGLNLPLTAACIRTSTCAGKAVGPATSRALDSGPVNLASADSRKLLYNEISSKHLIQTPFPELPTVTDRDREKIEKKRQKEEQLQRAAFESHRVSHPLCYNLSTLT